MTLFSLYFQGNWTANVTVSIYTASGLSRYKWLAVCKAAWNALMMFAFKGAFILWWY